MGNCSSTLGKSVVDSGRQAYMQPFLKSTSNIGIKYRSLPMVKADLLSQFTDSKLHLYYTGYQG